MALTLQKSMDECVYFTNRNTDKGKIKCWVPKEECPKCKKGLMGKPRDPKTGKPKIRATIYECPNCKYSASIQEYEDTLTANIIYTCPKCGNNGEIQIPFKRKKIKMFNEELQKEISADALQFQCQKCSKKINVTKKMK
ncbi:MAG TPA: hypothetical protein VJB94_03675 [Candidatus Nanoarchaeia archaeon]|nr:hypothetical protein [Candidatus Nanoarchaeia archaeon]